jgi:hypothetical protein
MQSLLHFVNNKQFHIVVSWFMMVCSLLGGCQFFGGTCDLPFLGWTTKLHCVLTQKATVWMVCANVKFYCVIVKLFCVSFSSYYWFQTACNFSCVYGHCYLLNCKDKQRVEMEDMRTHIFMDVLIKLVALYDNIFMYFCFSVVVLWYFILLNCL